jgi:hypothetical protein
MTLYGNNFQKNKYMATALIQFSVEASDPGEALKIAEKMRFDEKLGNLRECKHIVINFIQPMS